MKNIIKKIIIFFVPIELFNHAIFEFRSKLGRLFTNNIILNLNNKNYINLGCGNIYKENFINIDFYGTKNIDYCMDLRFPFKIKSNSIDGIFTEHTIEHLSHQEVDNVLNECYRILKTNAIIRIIVPDLSIFIKKYCSNDEAWFKKWHDLVLKDPSRHYMKKFFTKMFAINFTASYYFHKSCWDFESLENALSNQGFKNIKRFDYNIGTQALLIDSDNEDRKLVSIYMEAVKGN